MQQTAYGLYIYKHTPHGEEESTCASSEVISGFSSWSVTDAELSWSSGISTLSDSAIVEDLVSESWENFAYSEVFENDDEFFLRKKEWEEEVLRSPPRKLDLFREGTTGNRIPEMV